MIRKPLFIAAAFVITIICIFFYFHYRLPWGVTPQGDSTATVAWVALLTAIVSMVTAVVGLAQKILELRSRTIK